MSPIKSVLREELANSIRMEKDYKRELNKLLKGVLVKKKIKDQEYYYLAIRKSKNVKFKYLGKLSQDKVKEYQKAKEYRAKYRHLLSKVKKQIKFLRSSLREKEPI